MKTREIKLSKVKSQQPIKLEIKIKRSQCMEITIQSSMMLANEEKREGENFLIIVI